MYGRMKTFMRKVIRLSVLLGIAGPLLLNAAAPGTAKPSPANAATPALDTGAAGSNTIVAKGKSFTITRDQLDQELIRLKTTLAAQGHNVPADSALFERGVLDQLISKDLLLGKATAADKSKAKEKFDTAIENLKTNGTITEEEFNQRLNRQLQVLGLTRDQWEAQKIEEEEIPITLERQLNIKITDAQAKKFYDDNPGKFEVPERVRAAHILLMTIDPVTHKELSPEKKAAKKKELEGILKRARAGEDFGKLAKEYSEDPGSKDRGGVYTFSRGQMVPAFEAAAFSLKTNQISDIVTTPYGYHIIKLYEKYPAAMTPYDKVHENIKDYLARVEMSKQSKDYLEKLRKDADVKILDERLSSVQMPTPPEGENPNQPAPRQP